MLRKSLGHYVTAALACMVLLPLVVARAEFPNLPRDPPFNSVEVGHWDDYSGEYCDLTSDGQYVYLPNYGSSDGQTARIHILDISDPANPFLANTFFLPPPNDIESPQDVKVGDGLLFVGLNAEPTDGVAIVDIRDPLNATLVTTLSITDFKYVHNLFYDNGFLYFPGAGTKVGIVDLTALDPDNPPASPITSLTWMLDNVGSSFVHDITVVDGRLYLAAIDSGLWIYDVSDVANTIPTFLGSVGGSRTHSMWPTQDGRFVVTGEERSGGGIQVFGIIEDGGSLILELRDSFTYSTSAAFSVHNQAIVGNRLYNSWYEKGLQVFDIDPIDGTLTLVSTFDTSSCGGGNWGVYPFLGDEKILVSDLTEGLYIVNITAGPPIPAPAPHDILKNRYISIDPRGAAGINPSSHHIRVAVDSSLVNGLTGSGPWWATAPVNGQPPSPATCLSVLSATKPASEPDWSGCPVVHLTGCPIVPTTTYAIATEVGGVLSVEVLLATQAMPGVKWYGDCVGFFTGTEWTAPNGQTSIDDAVAAIKTFQNPDRLPGCPAPPCNATHTSVTDMVPNLTPGPQINLIVNIADVFAIIQGFQGQEYPGSDLTQCP